MIFVILFILNLTYFFKVNVRRNSNVDLEKMLYTKMVL